MPFTPNQKGQLPRETPSYVELAADALVDGWTRAQVVDALISRIRRDESYLAYRKASGRRTVYDEQVTTDLRALALAACWLDEADPLGRRPSDK